ncbi:hypothetical protein Tco_0988626 [Tanacetum coccineum]|uniref:Uncharacterized protein n=1 Tax=Tanacetum coccineum TaxID=301880 RepID=A0ABQ5ES26_9ASTR
MNCPLTEAFTKTPSVLYQNFLKEFWCTIVVEDPNPPEDDSKVRPLKEFIIKFTMMKGKNPLNLAHPSPKAVKAELAKITINEALVQKTPILKTSFPVAWRILKGRRSLKLCLNPNQRHRALRLLEHSLKRGKDSEGNKYPADMGLPATHPDEVTALLGTNAKYQVDKTQSTRFEVSVPDQNKGKTSYEVEPHADTIILTIVVDIQPL